MQLTAYRVYSQTTQLTVKGVVTDNEGRPLSGVSVAVKGSSQGTTTAINGSYTITVASAASTLVFSYVGFADEEVLIGKRRTINIDFKPGASTLNDVVVVGYGTQKKADLTGAVSVVDKKVLENRPVTNSLSALQGAAPGLIVTRSNGQPGQEGWSANIRGFSSLNGTNSPLVIVDGIEGDLTLINPNDIESVSVLKDAAAAAIYGAKSSGGVIIVTTKKGGTGHINVNYTGLYTIKHAYSIPQRLHSWEEAEMVDVAAVNTVGIHVITPQQLSWMHNPDSGFYQDPANPANIGYYYDLNQIPIIMRMNSPSQSHNIAVSGGDQKTQYLYSMGYYTEDGVFRFGPDGTSRLNARLNLTTKFNSKLSLDSRIAYTGTKTESPSAGVNGDFGLFYNIYQLRSIFPIFLPNTNNTKYAYTGSGSTTYEILKDGGYNHLLQNSFDGVFTLKAENLVKGLTLRAIYSPRFLQYNDENFARSVPLWTYSATGPVIASYLNPANSDAKIRSTQYSNDVQGLADYDLTAAGDHHVHLLGGFQYQSYNYDLISAQAKALISNDLPSLNFGSNPTVPPVISDNIQTNAWASVFGRLNYEYKAKYLLEATLRSDASSRLAPGHRAQQFPSVSAGWRLNKEPWFNNALPVFDEFKLRGSWGKLGNAQLGSPNDNNYTYIAQLVNGPAYPFNNAATPSLYQNALASSGLGWETIETWDAGLDLNLFRKRLSVSFDYFVRNNNNMLIVLNEPAVLGVTPSTTNAAAMRTWGWEASANWKDDIGQLHYTVGFNIGDNNNKITQYLGQVVYQEGLNVAIPGMPINSIFGYIDEGYFTSADDVTKHAFQDTRNGPGDIKYKDINDDKKINGGINTAENHGDLVYLGNTSPRYNFGINLGVNWKGFDLSAFFQGTGKRSMMIYSKVVVPFVDSYRQPTAINEDYWTPTNPNARFPRPYLSGTQNTYVSTHWLQNAAYIRWKNLQLGYTIPARITQKIKIARARIFFTGEDIWESTKMWFNYYNPENPNNASFNYPFFRSYAAGLNITL
jgi:TonB-linked SusC/RagA family outer membrane protein